LAQNKIKEKSQQVRKQSCDQDPKEWPHGPPASVRKNKPETEKPGSGHDTTE
jgi:hypothetical protein